MTVTLHLHKIIIKGYILCCSLAVFVGKILSKYISEKILNIFAAILFMAFGVVSLIEFILLDK